MAAPRTSTKANQLKQKLATTETVEAHTALATVEAGCGDSVYVALRRDEACEPGEARGTKLRADCAEEPDRDTDSIAEGVYERIQNQG